MSDSSASSSNEGKISSDGITGKSVFLTFIASAGKSKQETSVETWILHILHILFPKIIKNEFFISEMHFSLKN